MEQQDRSTEPYGQMKALFVGDVESVDSKTAAVEYALRNDILNAAGLKREDLYDVYIQLGDENSTAKTTFDLAIEPDSAKAYEMVKKMLTEKQGDDSWLTETRTVLPQLSLSSFTDDTSGLGGSGGQSIVDTTCRVNGLHCDHIKGIVFLLVMTIVCSAVGYYCVIHRPSKKRKANQVQEVQPNHTFVFTRSLGASTHRSAAGSFYGSGSRHGDRNAGPQVETYEINDEMALHHQSAGHHRQRQHPASFV